MKFVKNVDNFLLGNRQKITKNLAEKSPKQILNCLNIKLFYLCLPSVSTFKSKYYIII